MLEFPRIRQELIQENEYMTLTPLLLHGAEKAEARAMKAEWRIPSLKGELRYWYRALYAPRFDKTTSLAAAEGKLLGTAGGGGNEAQKSNVVLSEGLKKLRAEDGKKGPYIELYPPKQQASYGFEPKKLFSVQFAYQDEATRSIFEPLLRWFELIGGIGQRSRRGNGAFQATTDTFDSIEEYLDEIELNLQKIGIRYERNGQMLKTKEHSTLQHSVPTWKQTTVGCLFKSEVEARKSIIENAYQGYMYDGKKEVSGGIRPRFASPYHFTVRRIGQHFAVILTEVSYTLSKDTRTFDAAKVDVYHFLKGGKS